MSAHFHDDCEALEEAFVTQWANFGQAPGGTYHEDGELIWTEAPVSQLPYNAVIRTRISGNAEDRINGMLNHFQRRGVQFLWVVHPLSQPADLKNLLVGHGLLLAVKETGMCLDIGSWKMLGNRPSGPISYREVNDEETLEDFENLVEEYWGLPRETHGYVDGVSRWAYRSGDRGVWFLAYRQREAVGKAYLSLRGLDDTASIWGVYVKPAARGYGTATRLTEMAIRRAAELGKNRVVLASSQMAIKLYRRIGFRRTCDLLVFASDTLPAAFKGLQPL